MKIVFATSNEGKLKEIRSILGEYGFQIVSMKEMGVNPNIEENGATFEDNAIIKAKTVMEAVGEVVMADDSGLEVDYINKEPGIYSARYMGEDTPQTEKNKSIIDRLQNAEDNERKARFVCAIACVFPDGRILTTRGEVEGLIAYEEKGNNGFGYDPIMYLPEFGVTMAEMTSDQKNKISHRFKALRLMGEQIRENINS